MFSTNRQKINNPYTDTQTGGNKTWQWHTSNNTIYTQVCLEEQLQSNITLDEQQLYCPNLRLAEIVLVTQIKMKKINKTYLQAYTNYCIYDKGMYDC